MPSKYQEGQEFILTKGKSFYTDDNELYDFEKGQRFYINEIMEDNIRILWYFVIFDGIEIRLSEEELDEII